MQVEFVIYQLEKMLLQTEFSNEHLSKFKSVQKNQHSWDKQFPKHIPIPTHLRESLRIV